MSSEEKLQYGERKLNEVLKSSFNSFNETNCCQKSENFDKLMKLIKQKLLISSRTEKVLTLTLLKLLTLTPPSWTIEETTKYFGVTKCMFKKVRELVKMKVSFVNLTKREGTSEEFR